MPEGLGGIAFQGIENALENSPVAKTIGHDASQALINFSNHFFTLDSKLTGQGGEMIGKMKKVFEDGIDRDLNVATKGLQIPATGKPPVDPKDILSTVVTNNRAKVFGKKNQNLAVALAQVKKEHGPFGEAKVKELTDHLGIYFHDQKRKVSPGKYTSTIPNDLVKFKQFEDMDLEPSPFVKAGGIEKAAKKIGAGAFAYKAAIGHSVQGFVNSFFNARTSSMTKAVSELFGSGYEASKQQLIASNTVGDMLFREYSQVYNYRGGVLDKYLPNTVGEFIHRNYSIPGLTAARNVNMVYSGLVGKYEARQAAFNVAQGGKLELRGSLALSNLGLNWKDIQSRGGQLYPEEEQQAMRYMIDRNMFRGREGAKTQFASATPIGRLFTIFHSFSNMQSRLLVESTRRNLGQMHDPVMFMQQLAALAVVVPTVGNAIYSIDQAYLGKNKHPVDNFSGREKAIYSGRDFSEMIGAIAHMGGFGFASGTINAASRHRLANYMLGAPISAGLELGEDIPGAVTQDEKHPHAGDQFKRDLLHDAPTMGIGAWLANEYIPTRTQRDAARPMTVRRAKALAKRKSKKSN